MRAICVPLILGLAVGCAWGDSSEMALEHLRSRENSPAFRRAVIAYQTIREMYETAYSLPAIKPLAEVIGEYDALVKRLADKEPQTAARAMDRMLEIGFILGERRNMMAELEAFVGENPEVAAEMTVFGNPPPETVFGDGEIEVRGLELGELEDIEIISIGFEARSLTGKGERLALDLRVMNPERNCQTSCFFDVSAEGWSRHEITLGEMFDAHEIEYRETEFTYRVLPGFSVVRATFGTVPEWYEGRVNSDVAFEYQFVQEFLIRQSSIGIEREEELP